MCTLSCFSHVRLFATLGIVARQAPLSMGFSRQEYWSGLPDPPPGHLPDPGIEPVSLTSTCTGRVGSLSLAPPGKPDLATKQHQTASGFAGPKYFIYLFIFKRYFFIQTILKIFAELVTILLLFLCFGFLTARHEGS